MEVDGREIEFTVKYNKDTLNIKWNEDKSVLSLKEHLTMLIDIPVENQKLMYKGILKDQNTLKQSKIVHDSKLTLMGSSKASVDSVLNSKPTGGKFEPLRERPNIDHNKVTEKNRFHYINVLPLPHAEKATAMLERIRSDLSVKHLMEKYNWNVLYLRELSLEHTKLLGWNCNQGLEIMLRLRCTKEEPNEFRSYEEVKDVLLHELTHMIWGDHDHNFHAFNRQLQKEVEEFEKRQNRSQVMLETEKSSGGAVGGGSGAGGMYKLFRPQEMALMAAERRISEREQALVNGCGASTEQEMELVEAAVRERNRKEKERHERMKINLRLGEGILFKHY